MTEDPLLKRLATLFALLTLLAVPQAFAGTGFIKSLATAQKQAKEKNRLIFVDLFAEWCGWCHRFDREVVPSEAFQKATEDMVLLRLDTEDGGEGTKFAQQYRITTLPYFLVLNPDLSVAAVIKGYAPAPQFVQMMKDTLARNTEFLKMVATEPKLAKNYDKRIEIASEFRQRQAWEESEPRYRKLITEKGVPEKVRDQAYFELANQYMQQQKHADVLKTVDAFSKIQSKGESFERAQLLIIDVALAQGRFPDAISGLKKFKTRFPSSTFLPDIDRVLTSLERQVAVSR
jgi:thioredoxin-related protein